MDVPVLSVFLIFLRLSQGKDSPIFSGWPPRRATVERNAPEAERKQVFMTNGFEWPQLRSFKGWPPAPDGKYSAEYIKSRDQIEAHIRNIPLNVHHRNDDFEELAQSVVLPRFTEVGFKVVDAPKDIWEQFRSHYQENKKTTQRERFHGNHLFTDPEHVPRVIRDRVQNDLNYRATEAIKPILEEWSGVELIPTSTYGVRVYGNGSTLYYHIDVPDTHVVSAIFHIDHDLDEPWPLEIEDHNGQIHAVSPKPGQLVMYESATQYHGRVTPMRGRDYGSVFIHFKPVGWNWTRTDIVSAVPPDSKRPTPRDSQRQHIFDLGHSPIETYRRKYYKARGLPFLDFTGDDLLALPVQNAAMMTAIVPHSEL